MLKKFNVFYFKLSTVVTWDLTRNFMRVTRNVGLKTLDLLETLAQTCIQIYLLISFCSEKLTYKCPSSTLPKNLSLWCDESYIFLQSSAKRFLKRVFFFFIIKIMLLVTTSRLYLASFHSCFSSHGSLWALKLHIQFTQHIRLFIYSRLDAIFK